MKEKAFIIILLIHAPASCSSSQKQVWPTKRMKTQKEKVELQKFLKVKSPYPDEYTEDEIIYQMGFKLHHFLQEPTSQLHT
jgi:hypothetical protein